MMPAGNVSAGTTQFDLSNIQSVLVEIRAAFETNAFHHFIPAALSAAREKENCSSAANHENYQQSSAERADCYYESHDFDYDENL